MVNGLMAGNILCLLKWQATFFVRHIELNMTERLSTSQHIMVKGRFGSLKPFNSTPHITSHIPLQKIEDLLLSFISFALIFPLEQNKTVRKYSKRYLPYSLLCILLILEV